MCAVLCCVLWYLLLQLRGGVWWVDASNAYVRSKLEAQAHHSGPQMTLDALKRDIAALKA
jgi:hypothetical protein